MTKPSKITAAIKPKRIAVSPMIVPPSRNERSCHCPSERLPCPEKGHHLRFASKIGLCMQNRFKHSLTEAVLQCYLTLIHYSNQLPWVQFFSSVAFSDSNPIKPTPSMRCSSGIVLKVEPFRQRP